MKLNTLHEAWDWKKFGKGAGAGIALGASALTTGNLVNDTGRFAGINRSIHADTHLVNNPNVAGKPTTRPVERPSEASPTTKPATAVPVAHSPQTTNGATGNAKDTLWAKEFGTELPIIRQAAERNDCKGDLFPLLLAIRKSENGSAHQFGILNPKAKGLESQAAWSAATIVKNHERWKAAGSKGSFITYLGGIYCPVGASNDPTGLNANWIKNVTAWYNKLK